MAKYITEILEEVNTNPQSIVKYKDNYAIKSIFEYSFDPNLKFILPEGAPPYKKDTAPIGMSQANFYQQVKKLYIFRRTDISNVRREQLFVQLLESLHPSEAEVCIAIKDQNLTSLYPNVTRALVESAGFVKPLSGVVVQELPSKSQGRNLVIGISDSANTRDHFGKGPQQAQTATQEVVKRGRGRPPGSRNKT